MLLLYYTSTILLSLGIQRDNGLIDSIDAYDRKHLSQYVCMARCRQNKERNFRNYDFHSTDDFINKRSYLFSSSSIDYNNRSFLENCISFCGNSVFTLPVKQIQENYLVNLICRDESSLHFRIELFINYKRKELSNKAITIMDLNNHNYYQSKTNSFISNISNIHKISTSTSALRSASTYTIYVIKLHLHEDREKYQIFLSDDNFFTMESLIANRIYNITIIAVHSSNEYSVIAKQQQFSTLRRNYTPNNVTNIKVKNLTIDPSNSMHLIAIIEWKPSRDRTCHYDIICFSPDSEDYELTPIEIRNPNKLYRYELSNLTFSTIYKIGIRSRHMRNMKESELFWKSFQTPSCNDWYQYNFSICAPSIPQNLNVEQIYIKFNTYELNISWSRPDYMPDNYTLLIIDRSERSQSSAQTYLLTKELNFYFISEITLTGIFYEVQLSAHTKGGKSTAIFTDLIKTILEIPNKDTAGILEKWSTLKTFAIILCIITIILLIIILFIIHQRRNKLKNYEKRKNFEDFKNDKIYNNRKDQINSNEKISFRNDETIKSKYQFNIESKLTKDALEIDCSRLSLFEILGEGAFGLVKRGLYKLEKNTTRIEVAVKMLKNHPTLDEIQALRQEIEVMKSVEKHPNIISLIGYSTRNSSHMMLLTEYCSFGNLLDFLRSEWHSLQEMQQLENRTSQKYFDFKLPFITSLSNSIQLSNNPIIKKSMQNNLTNTNKNSSSFPDIITDTTKVLKISNSNINDQKNTNIMQIIHDAQYEYDEIFPTEVYKNTSDKKLDTVFTKNEKKTKNSISLDNQLYFKYMDTDNRKQINERFYNSDNTNTDKSKLKLSLSMDGQFRNTLTSSDLLDIARQVAVGMDFLAKHKVVHRDLAARNVLVSLNRTVKIADFGLSRDIYRENIYKRTGHGKLPIKWLALESLTHQFYTTQSDVWSYGILLYEIVTLGSTPYPSIPINRLVHLLRMGYRMEQPKNCSPDFYALMLSCWQEVPTERPTFEQIIKLLNDFLNNKTPSQMLMNYINTDVPNGNLKTTTDDSYLNPL